MGQEGGAEAHFARVVEKVGVVYFEVVVRFVLGVVVECAERQLAMGVG